MSAGRFYHVMFAVASQELGSACVGRWKCLAKGTISSSSESEAVWMSSGCFTRHLLVWSQPRGIVCLLATRNSGLDLLESTPRYIHLEEQKVRAFTI